MLRWLPLTALLLTGCTTNLPFYAPCTSDLVPLDAAEVGQLGFSAEQLTDAMGSEWALTAQWVGRHSQSPASDSFAITLGDITAVSEQISTPTQHGTAAECAEQSRLIVTYAADFASADGQVVGSGALEYRAPSLDAATVEISGSTETLTLHEDRWLEIDAALDDDLDPPEETALHVGRYAHGDYASINADGPNYNVAVWKCDEQIKGECATWE